jgi:hypothetical protein
MSGTRATAFLLVFLVPLEEVVFRARFVLEPDRGDSEGRLAGVGGNTTLSTNLFDRLGVIDSGCFDGPAIVPSFIVVSGRAKGFFLSDTRRSRATFRECLMLGDVGVSGSQPPGAH